MSNGIRSRCSCPRCTIRSLMGPAVIITIGLLFLLQQMRGGAFDFENTWPFLLIVIGVILLASSAAPGTGHVEGATGSVVPPTSPASPAPSQSSLTGPGR